jgi:hypothetical protein
MMMYQHYFREPPSELAGPHRFASLIRAPSPPMPG